MKVSRMNSTVLSAVFAVASAVGVAGCGGGGITNGNAVDADACPDAQPDVTPDVSTPDISVPDAVPDVGTDAVTDLCAACAKNEKKIVLLTVNGKTNVAPIVEGAETKMRLQEGGAEYAFAASMVGDQLVLTSKGDVTVVLTDGTALTGSAVVMVSTTADSATNPTLVKIGNTTVEAKSIVEVSRDTQDTKATTSAHVWMADTVANTFAEWVVSEGEALTTENSAGAAVIEKVTSNGVFVRLSANGGEVATPERVYLGEGTVLEGYGLKFGVTASNNTVKPGCTDKVYTLNFKGEDREVRVGETHYFGDVKVEVIAAVFDEKESGNARLVVKINGGDSKFLSQNKSGVSVDGSEMKLTGQKEASLLPALCAPTAKLDRESARKFADFAGPRAKALARAMNDALKGKVAGKTC